MQILQNIGLMSRAAIHEHPPLQAAESPPREYPIGIPNSEIGPVITFPLQKEKHTCMVLPSLKTNPWLGFKRKKKHI
jgi:hypothetical protein